MEGFTVVSPIALCTSITGLSLPDEVADYLRSQELEYYWSIVGVASEQELVDTLTAISPPPPPITLTNEYDGVNVSQNVGCFTAGAGVVNVGAYAYIPCTFMCIRTYCYLTCIYLQFLLL